jgi:hypothetical protein
VGTFQAVLIWIHILAGSLGLLVFWIPIFARKGSKLHICLGKVFVYCSYLVGLSALVISVAKFISLSAGRLGLQARPWRASLPSVRRLFFLVIYRSSP